MFDFKLNLQLFADAGYATNATTTMTNAYTGQTVARTNSNSMTAGMKSFYDTALLENVREKMSFSQLGRKETLPERHGKTIEWRKWNTLPDIQKLQEGVIPTGRTFGQTSITADVDQFGDFVAVTDVLDLQYVDDVILGATEELGAAAAKTYEKIVRYKLRQGTRVMYADNNDGTENVDDDALVAAIANKPYLTPTMVNKVVTKLKKLSSPTYSGGKYACVIHPSCTFDLRQSEEWIDCHKYMNTTEIFNGEIGELHGCRFIESNMAPTKTVNGKIVYEVMFFGKDAFAVIDPAGAGMETIVKDKSQVGGPLSLAA